MNKIREIQSAIIQSENIGLISHIHPDGDNIGSVIGLGFALKKLKKNIYLFKSDDIPKTYTFLNGVEQFSEYQGQKLDLLIVLDSSDLERIGDQKELLKNSKLIANIDHHVSNLHFGDMAYVNEKASSTCEIVYQLIKEMNIEPDILIASALYTGISSDTGSFMFSSTTAKTMRVAAELLDIGIDADFINRKLYQSRSLEKTALIGHVLNTMDLLCEKTVLVGTVTNELLEKVSCPYNESGDIISFLNEIEGVELTILLKQYGDFSKVSMRSKGKYNVSDICGHFGGGGHERAAGCTLNTDVMTAKKQILSYLFGEGFNERLAHS